MIKAIIFDCFGVLTGDKWKEFVGTLPADELDGARRLIRALDGGVIDLDEFCQEVQELSGCPFDEIREVIEAQSHVHKNQQLVDYVATLKPTYKIGLLSNVSTNWISEQLLTPEEMALFDDVVLSYKVGMTKPDPRIYKLAAEHLKVSETECLMVDDSENNCEGARAVGMQSICYQDFVQFKSELETLLR